VSEQPRISKAGTGVLGRWRNVPRFLWKATEFLPELAAQGDLVRFKLGPKNAYLVNHPDLIEQVLVRNYGPLSRGGGFQGHHFGRGSAFALEGDEHERRRALIEQVFGREDVERFGHGLGELALEAAKDWRDGDVVDIAAAMSTITLRGANQLLLGADAEAEFEATSSAFDASREAFHRTLLPFAVVLWALPLPVTRRYKQALGRFDSSLDRLIEQRRRTNTTRDDWLGLLIAARDGGENGACLSDEQIRGEAFSYIVQGAPAQAMTWTWFLLSNHPEVEARLHAELDNALTGSQLPADLPRLPYARNVLEESLRLYPPAWAIARETERDYELGGDVLRKGSLVLISPYLMNRDARYWPDPERFDPDRWDAHERPPRLTYLTFGAGERACFGQGFARMICLLVIATLARRWRLRLVSDTVEHETFPFLQPKGGLQVRLEQRS
jgi:cytochrome P450